MLPRKINKNNVKDIHLLWSDQVYKDVVNDKYLITLHGAQTGISKYWSIYATDTWDNDLSWGLFSESFASSVCVIIVLNLDTKEESKCGMIAIQIHTLDPYPIALFQKSIK